MRAERSPESPPTMPLASAAPTIATKLVVPASPGYLIIRKRLLDILDAGTQGPLTVLCGPAGAGKTILLASWIQTRRPPGPVAWLSLDQDDDDACRLATDLLGALRAAGVIKHGSALDRLSPPLGARADAFLATLINGLARLRADFVLVLDDLHELSSPQATAIVDFLVRHAPSQCHLVLAGRADPPIPIERLRVGGRLSELRVGDLAFDREETAKLCQQLGLDLSEQDVETLWRRTEGWPAALRLAGLSVQGGHDSHQLISELAGTNRAVSDYLVSEVLSHLPMDKRTFMLRTCLVDCLHPELADVLCGSEGGATTLAALERCGAPVQLVGAAEPCYRYHPLFAELLRAHLRHSHPDELPTLHRRAARWYSEQGQIRAAVRHALAGESWEQAGSMIEQSWLDLFLMGASATMRGPISKLPTDVIATRPRLAAAFAGSRLEDGDLQSADYYLSLARGFDQEDDEQLEVTLAVVSLVRARMRLDLDGALDHGNQLTRLARDPAYPSWSRLRSFALSQMGATLLWAGQAQAATAPLREALALADEARCEHVALDCRAQLAIVHLLEGRLTCAERAASEAVGLTQRNGWEEGPAPACGLLALGVIAYLRGEPQRAEGLAAQAARAAETAELPVRLAIRALQAVTLSASGPLSAARGAVMLEAVRAATADSSSLPVVLHVLLEDASARTAISAYDPQVALVAIKAAAARVPGCAAMVVRLAEGKLHAGDPDGALGLLAELRERQSKRPQSMAHPVVELEAWLIWALAKHAAGAPREVSDAVEQALAAAEHERIYGPFLTCGSAMRDLLEAHAERGTDHPALLETLLDALELGGSAGEELTLAEPLTDRELKILRYLPTMLSNAEIGAETFVSLNTVKTHLRSIYRKLGASNRADAVQRARTLGLLPRGVRRPRVVRRSPHTPKRRTATSSSPSAWMRSSTP